MLGGGGNPSAWWDVRGERTAHDAGGTATDLSTIAQGNDYVGVSVTTTTSAADAWWAPIDTISNSENGFERMYQGSALLLSWPVHLAQGERWTRTIGHVVATTRDRATEAAMSRPSLVVHGHFYQPPRLDPFTGTTPLDPTAAPAHDWNARTSADCYRPNAELGNLGAISWDLGPTLAGWMEGGDPVAYRGFVDGDAGGNGMAQPFHHAILPLASAADRLTEIRWGVRDFEVRFGRRPTGMWLPETAVDLPTLRLLAEHGITYTILAPWQIEDGGLRDPRRPVRVDLGDGRSMVVIRYDGLLSAAVSFEPWSTVDADAFVTGHVAPALASRAADDDDEQLLVIATDGELYGHHQPFREHFLARLVGRTAPADLPYDRPSLGDAVARAVARGLETGTPPRADVVELRPRHRSLDDWL